jgi:hypothetical protein
VYCAEIKGNLCENKMIHSFRFIELWGIRWKI